MASAPGKPLQGPYFCSWATRKSQLLYGNHMLGTLDFTATEQVWKAFLNQLMLMFKVHACTAVHIVCLQCSIKKWSWQVFDQ